MRSGLAGLGRSSGDRRLGAMQDPGNRAQGVTGGGSPCARSPTQVEQGGIGTRVPPSTSSPGSTESGNRQQQQAFQNTLLGTGVSSGLPLRMPCFGNQGNMNYQGMMSGQTVPPPPPGYGVCHQVFGPGQQPGGAVAPGVDGRSQGGCSGCGFGQPHVTSCGVNSGWVFKM